MAGLFKVSASDDNVEEEEDSQEEDYTEGDEEEDDEDDDQSTKPDLQELKRSMSIGLYHTFTSLQFS